MTQGHSDEYNGGRRSRAWFDRTTVGYKSSEEAAPGQGRSVRVGRQGVWVIGAMPAESMSMGINERKGLVQRAPGDRVGGGRCRRGMQEIDGRIKEWIELRRETEGGGGRGRRG